MTEIDKETNQIFHQRGDKLIYPIEYDFKKYDVLAFAIYNKSGLDEKPIVFEKFTIAEDCSSYTIEIDSDTMKIGEMLNKKKDYWYEISLNDEKTLVGYEMSEDETGNRKRKPAIFTLLPEGATLDRPSRYSLEIGEVSTGDEASATIEDNVLNLVLPRGEQGIEGKQGEKGASFKYEDFTPKQLETLRGPEGPQGLEGKQGIQGEKGEPFRFEDFTEEQLESLRGPKGDSPEIGAITNEEIDEMFANPHEHQYRSIGTAQNNGDGTHSITYICINSEDNCNEETKIVTEKHSYTSSEEFGVVTYTCICGETYYELAQSI